MLVTTSPMSVWPAGTAPACTAPACTAAACTAAVCVAAACTATACVATADAAVAGVALAKPARTRAAKAAETAVKNPLRMRRQYRGPGSDRCATGGSVFGGRSGRLDRRFDEVRGGGGAGAAVAVVVLRGGDARMADVGLDVLDPGVLLKGDRDV